MNKNLLLIGLWLLLETSITYCPVKCSYFDRVWLFVFENTQRPSVANWKKMTEEQKEDWWHLYKNKPTLFMKSEHKRTYIFILLDMERRVPFLSLGGLNGIDTENDRNELLADIRKRLAVARS